MTGKLKCRGKVQELLHAIPLMWEMFLACNKNNGLGEL